MNWSTGNKIIVISGQTIETFARTGGRVIKIASDRRQIKKLFEAVNNKTCHRLFRRKQVK